MSCRIFFDSTAATIVAWRKCRFRFLFFDERMCRLNPLLRLIFPVPVRRNLFAADRLVLIFGTEILLYFNSLGSEASFRRQQHRHVSSLQTRLDIDFGHVLDLIHHSPEHLPA
jgi:hypothetical protein